MKVLDLLVETSNPDTLDHTVQQLGAAAVVGGGKPGSYVREDGCYRVRCFGCADWIRFAIERQGYGKVVGEVGVVKGATDK